MENPQMSWQNSSDVLQGIMVGPDAHPPNLTMGDSTSNTLLDLHLDTDLSSLEAHHHNQSFLGQWSSSTEPHNFYYPNYPSRVTGAQDAWNPLQITGVPNQPSMSHLNVSPGGDDYAFHKPHYRTPSDSGSQYMGSLVSGDSGYGSNNGASQSVVPSSYGMDSSPHISAKEHGFGEALALYDQPQMGSSSGNIPFMKDLGDCASLSLESVKCDHPACTWVGKCPSDKRKHEARHRKSFKCDEPNCPRKEGFGTINDLARHKKCVHNKEPERGPKMKYLCFGKSCPRTNKHWPRLDNFKQHLSRMHHEEDADALLKKSMDWYESVTGHRGQKIEDTSSQDDSMLDIPQDMMSTHSEDMDIEPADSSFGSYDTVDFPSSRAPTPKPPQTTSPEVHHTQHQLPLGTLASSPSLVNDGHEPSLEQRNNTNPESFVTDVADNLITAMTKKMNNRPRRQSHQTDEGISLEPESPNLSEPQRQILQKVLLAALDRLSDDPQPATAITTTTTPSIQPDTNPGFQCNICSKRTRLRCEMKKHQKRHERPYGCTFPHCAKSFGSKADWKRHESSQHLQVPSWLCSSSSSSSSSSSTDTTTTNQTKSIPTSCGRIFYREETFIQHLSQAHRTPKTKVKSTLNESRLDLAGQRHFWCGFCKRDVKLVGSGAQALDERFNHIDAEHFKKGERGADWCFPGAGLDASTTTGEDGTVGDYAGGVELRSLAEDALRRKRRCPGL